ncbi:MAG: pyridoxal-phosphate-dependent aminotransferase family protein [Gemmatimonadaceae bacterium]|jgi:aspartate aminotransferase-like enzyme
MSFFVPGPTEVRPEVLAAMTQPMIPHRSAAFEALYARCAARLQAVFRTTRPVYIHTASATGMMEAGMRAAPAGRVLAMVNGAFSGRYAAIARGCGREVEELNVPWGEAIPLEQVEAALRTGRFTVVTGAHSETTTGVLQDPQAITALARRFGAMALIDSVTGLGGAALETDAWGLDYVLSGSQKAIAAPPGLSFAVASEPFLAQAAQQPARGRYLDLVELDTFAAQHNTPATPAVSLFYALDVALDRIIAETMEARWARHLAMRHAVEQWVESGEGGELGIGILAPKGIRAPTVSVLTIPSAIGAERLWAAVRERGVTLGTGYGPLAATTLRIGHMGEHTVEGVEHALQVIAEEAHALTR